MASKKHIFSPVEKKVFTDIIKSYANVVENKNTDSASLRDKNQAWDNITREYNASPHIVTSEVSNKQLRRLWMNLKQRQREALTKERQHRMATGGGPSTSGADIDPDVALIAPGLMVEIPDAIDSDDIFQESITASIDIDDTQPLDIQRPSTNSVPDLSPVPSPTTTPQPPPLIVTLPPPPPPLRTITTQLPRMTTTPPPPSNVSTPLPPPSTSTSSQLRRQNILEKEYADRFNRATEIHALEKELLAYKIREAKAKAELAELILQRECLQREGTE